MAKNIFLALLVLLFASSALYLVPSFSYVYNDKRYSFDNYPSPFNKYEKDLAVKIPRLTDTYVYSMESSTKLDKQEDWNNLVAKDQRILEQRLETVIGNNYEIGVKNTDGKAVYTVYSNARLASTSILTATNTIFSIKTQSSTTASSDLTGTSTNAETLNLKREDFGFAEVIPTTAQDGTTQSGIRMPLGLLLTADKIKLISDNIGSQLKIEVGESEYDGYIDYNQTGTPTNLIISGITSIEEATYVKAFLNTPQYNLAYNLIGIQNISASRNKVLLFVGIILLSIIAAVITNKFTIDIFQFKKALLIVALWVIFAAGLKFFNLELTYISIMVLSIMTLFSIYSLKPMYYVSILLALGTIKAFGILNGFDISGGATVLTILFSIFIMLTNYVEYKQKKLA